MVLLRMIGGDEIHICNSLMHRLAKDKSIGRFKKSASGSYTHVSNSITKQSRLQMMIVQDMCDDDSEHDTDNADLEHIVRKVFNNVQDVSRVDVVVNALKHVKLEQCMKQLEFQYGIDKLKLFLLESTNGNLSPPVCGKIAIGMSQYKRVGDIEFFRAR